VLSGKIRGTMMPANATLEAANAICSIFGNIYFFLYSIAGGIGVVVITLQGIRWTSSAEDQSIRKSAKQGIIHVVIGLIIVMLAVTIVEMVFPLNDCYNYFSI
jgi:Na+-driven multidrug efflux pump